MSATWLPTRSAAIAIRFACSSRFAAEQLQRKVDKIKVTEISAALVRSFLTYLKEVRHCGTNTHNQRLAAIHALAVFVANRSPEHLAWCSEVRAVPFKKSARTVVHYLDKAEVDALLAVAKQRQLTAQGRRDYAMLLFLYNTGARADEAARLTIADIYLTPADWNGQAYVQIRGKGAARANVHSGRRQCARSRTPLRNGSRMNTSF